MTIVDLRSTNDAGILWVCDQCMFRVLVTDYSTPKSWWKIRWLHEASNVWYEKEFCRASCAQYGMRSITRTIQENWAANNGLLDGNLRRGIKNVNAIGIRK